MSSLLERVRETPEVLRRFKRRLQIKAAYAELFDSPQGQIVFRDLARRSGLHETSFEPGDPQHTAFKEGRRSLFLEILQQLRWSEGEIAQLARKRDPDALSAATEGDV